MCVYIYIYIYTYMCTHTLELMMKMALEKGYIFPLKLKINKMVSNEYAAFKNTKEDFYCFLVFGG